MVGFLQTFDEFSQCVYGFFMRFCRIRRFTLKNATINNPVTFGVQLGQIENYIGENLCEK